MVLDIWTLDAKPIVHKVSKPPYWAGSPRLPIIKTCCIEFPSNHSHSLFTIPFSRLFAQFNRKGPSRAVPFWSYISHFLFIKFFQGIPSRLELTNPVAFAFAKLIVELSGCLALAGNWLELLPLLHPYLWGSLNCKVIPSCIFCCIIWKVANHIPYGFQPNKS